MAADNEASRQMQRFSASRRLKSVAVAIASLIGLLGFSITVGVAIGWITIENLVYVPIIVGFGISALSWPIRQALPSMEELQ